MSEHERRACCGNLASEVARLTGESTRVTLLATGACCGNLASEVARLTGENTRLQFESTRLGGELTRLSDENARLAAEVKRLTNEGAARKKYIYLMDPAYEYSTTRDSTFQYGLIVGSWCQVKTLNGEFLLSSEVSPQGHKLRFSEVIFDRRIADVPGLAFLREVSY